MICLHLRLPSLGDLRFGGITEASYGRKEAWPEWLPLKGSWEWCTETAVRLPMCPISWFEGKSVLVFLAYLPPSCTYSHGLWHVLHAID